MGANATIIAINDVPTPLSEEQGNLGSPEFASLEDSFCRAVSPSHVFTS